MNVSAEWQEGYRASETKEDFFSCNYEHCPYPVDSQKWEDWCQGYEAHDLAPIQIRLSGVSNGIAWST